MMNFVKSAPNQLDESNLEVQSKVKWANMNGMVVLIDL